MTSSIVSASDCDMRQEVTKTATSHCEVIRVSTRRLLKEVRRRIVAVEESLTGRATLPTSTRHREAPSRATAYAPQELCFSAQMLRRNRRRTERKARSLQHLKDPPFGQCFGLAPAKSVSRLPQSLVTQARCARPLSLHRTDVVRHLTLRDAPLYWMDAPYCPKSEVHGRSELQQSQSPKAHTHTHQAAYPASATTHIKGTPQPRANGTWGNALLTCALNCQGQ